MTTKKMLLDKFAKSRDSTDWKEYITNWGFYKDFVFLMEQLATISAKEIDKAKEFSFKKHSDVAKKTFKSFNEQRKMLMKMANTTVPYSFLRLGEKIEEQARQSEKARILEEAYETLKSEKFKLWYGKQLNPNKPIKWDDKEWLKEKRYSTVEAHFLIKYLKQSLGEKE